MNNTEEIFNVDTHFLSVKCKKYKFQQQQWRWWIYYLYKYLNPNAISTSESCELILPILMDWIKTLNGIKPWEKPNPAN